MANTVMTKRKNTKEVHLGKTLMQLGRWITIGRKNIQLGLTNDFVAELNEEIRYINQQHKTYIDLAESWTRKLIDDLKGWWRILQARRASELEIRNRKEIEESIEKRCQMIDGKQGKMLISLLDKPTKKIKIDQLIKDEKNGRKLLIEADEVLDETKRHYQSQFRSRNFDQNILKER